MAQCLFATNVQTALGVVIMEYRSETKREICLEEIRIPEHADTDARRRRSSLIFGDRLQYSSNLQTSSQVSGHNQSTTSPSTSEWTRGEEEVSSILANLNGNRSSHDCREDATATSVSSAVSARLFTAYFANIHPIWPILYMPMHDYGNSNLHSDAFAPAVLYAVYAIAACVEPLDTLPSAAPEDQTPPPAVFFEGKPFLLRTDQQFTMCG
jgi:hypothetical protein